jgi:hypothetical protein
MTDLEKMQWQTEQDQITLDFSRWSQQQTRAGLSNDHNLWKELRDDVLARQQASNAESRRKYLAGLEAAKAEKKREYDTQIDRELEPTKQTLMRGWLANNPYETAADFEKKAWIHLRENLIEQRKNEAFQAEMNAQMATGRYSL